MNPADSYYTELAQKESAQRDKWLEENDPGCSGQWPWEYRETDWQASIKRVVYKLIKDDPHFRTEEGVGLLDYAPVVLDSNIRWHLYCLLTLAEHGQPKAIHTHAALAIELAKTLSELAEKHPVSLSKFAQTQLIWPILKSPHRHFSKDEKQIFKTLEVGKRHPLKIDESAHWDPHDEAGKLVLEMYVQLQAWRDMPETVFSLRQIHLRQKGYDDQAEWEYAAHRLPEFRQDEKVADQWAKVAISFLRKHPEKLAALKVPKSKRRRKPGISSAVFTKIRDKFLSMADANKH